MTITYIFHLQHRRSVGSQTEIRGEPHTMGMDHRRFLGDQLLSITVSYGDMERYDVDMCVYVRVVGA